MHMLYSHYWQPGVRCSTLAPDGTFVEYFYDDARTNYDAFVRGLKQSSELLISSFNGLIFHTHNNTYGLIFRQWSMLGSQEWSKS